MLVSLKWIPIILSGCNIQTVGPNHAELDNLETHNQIPDSMIWDPGTHI